MTTLDNLKQRAKAGDLNALQELRERGFFRQTDAAGGHPVSDAQRRLWVVDQMAGGTGAYNLPIALELSGELDPAALREALRAVVRRHETLRTTFAAAGGAVRQIVHDDIDLPWMEFDLAHHPDPAQEARRIAAEHAARPFDLARGPLLRAGLLRLAPDRHLFLFNLHHIVGDLISLGILASELSICYAAFIAGQAPALDRLPTRYRDFAARQEQLLAGAEAEGRRTFWLAHLSAPLPRLDMPADFVRPPLKTYAGKVCRATLGGALTGQLRRLGAGLGMSLFMVLAATVKVLLHRCTGQQDIVVGFPLAGRDDPDLDGLVGCFVNTVALRSQLNPEDSFTAVLGQMREAMLGVYAHGAYPFDRLVEELAPKRDISRSPVFDVSISLANAEPAALRFGNATVARYDDGFASAKLDLSFDFYEAADGLELDIAYATDLFAADRVQRMGGHLLQLAAHAAAHPEQEIGRLPMMAPAELAQVVQGFNATHRPPSSATVIELVERQAERLPRGVAVSSGGRALRYEALIGRADRLARRLKQAGVGAGTVVGTFLQPSEAVPVAFLGILKAGGVYLPLDPATPPLRLAGMLEDAAPAVILTEAGPAGMPAGFSGAVMALDDGDEAWGVDAAPAAGEIPLDASAYAIFTSGSTGRPKAVVLTHHGLANVACEQARLFAAGPGDRVLQFAALGFDASIFEMVLALTSGATLCMPGREALLPGAPLLATLEREAVSVATLPPSTLAALPQTPLPKLRILAVAGEACSAELVRRWAPGRAFFNLYGPTEATIWASAACCRVGEGTPTLGRPIGNTRFYILDQHRQPAPVGIPGELCIAGAGLALGYLNRPELTAARFVPDPFDPAPGARLYLTGDRARWRADGAIEFLGRTDAQVKLRGHRIEVGEVEAVLAQHPDVADAAVLMSGQAAPAQEAGPGEQRLIAYTTPRDCAAPPSAPELRQFLLDRLPDYMAPARIVLLDAMPLTPNKKIDRAALPAPDAARPELAAAFAAPRDNLEQALAALFAGVLKVERVGAVDDFFELGGNSLMAIRIVSQVRDAFRADITIPQLFRAATVAELAGLLRAALPEGQADAIAAALRRLQTMSPAEKQAMLRQRSG